MQNMQDMQLSWLHFPHHVTLRSAAETDQEKLVTMAENPVNEPANYLAQADPVALSH